LKNCLGILLIVNLAGDFFGGIILARKLPRDVIDVDVAGKIISGIFLLEKLPRDFVAVYLVINKILGDLLIWRIT